MASGQGCNPSQPESADHFHPDRPACPSQNPSQSRQEHVYSGHGSSHYPAALDHHYHQLQAYPQPHHQFQPHLQYHTRDLGQTPNHFQSVQPDHYQDQYAAYSSPPSGAPLTHQQLQASPISYSASVLPPIGSVPRTSFVTSVATVTAAPTSHSIHSNSPISSISPASTSPTSVTAGYQTTRTHGRYASTPHVQHSPYPISSSLHQHPQAHQQQQHEHRSHPQTVFRKRRTQPTRMSDESEGEGGESDEAEIPVERQVPGDISRLSTHSKRKIYVSGLEGYITDSREALRQKGVESPELSRAATSTGLTSATKTDLLAKGRGKIDQVRQTIGEQETHLAQVDKQDSA